METNEEKYNFMSFWKILKRPFSLKSITNKNEKIMQVRIKKYIHECVAVL
jgi:hypothetical protein